MPAFDVPAGSEMYFCYHFQTPNDREIALKTLTANMQGAAAKDLDVILTSANIWPAGTLSAANCQLPPFALPPELQAASIYRTHNASDTLTFPEDDGTGKPLAMTIPAKQTGFIRMRVVNPTDNVAKVSASLAAKALPTGAAYTRTAPLITSNTEIDVPANAVNDVETKSCDVPVGAKFWRVTTHTHRRGVSARVLDGADPVVVTNGWEAPSVATFSAPAFKTFASGKLTYSCTYTNPGPRRLAGSSPSLDEACMAVTYYFPVTATSSFLSELGARFCLNDGLIQ